MLRYAYGYIEMHCTEQNVNLHSYRGRFGRESTCYLKAKKHICKYTKSLKKQSLFTLVGINVPDLKESVNNCERSVITKHRALDSLSS